MIDVAIAVFVIAGCVATARLLKGPGLADRIAALDVTLICFMGAIAARSAGTNDTTYLIALVVLAIVGFTATVAAARFLQHEDTLPLLRATSSDPDDSAAGAHEAADEKPATHQARTGGPQ